MVSRAQKARRLALAGVIVGAIGVGLTIGLSQNRVLAAINVALFGSTLTMAAFTWRETR